MVHNPLREIKNKILSSSSPPSSSESEFVPVLPLKRSEEEEEVLNKSFDLWESLVQGYEIHRTIPREEALLGFLQSFCHNDLKEWKLYCEKIASTPFLLGKGKKGWKISFEWALVQQNAIKVLEGAYYSEEKGEAPQESPSSQLPKIDINAWAEVSAPPSLNALWQKVGAELVEEIGLASFQSWIMPIKLVEASGSRVLLNAPSSFMKTYIDTHYKFAILRAFQEAGVDAQELEIDYTPQKLQKINGTGGHHAYLQKHP